MIEAAPGTDVAELLAVTGTAVTVDELDVWLGAAVDALTVAVNTDDYAPLYGFFAAQVVDRVSAVDGRRGFDASSASGHVQVSRTDVTLLAAQPGQVRVKVFLWADLGSGADQVWIRQMWTVMLPPTLTVHRCPTCGAPAPFPSGVRCGYCAAPMPVDGAIAVAAAKAV